MFLSNSRQRYDHKFLRFIVNDTYRSELCLLYPPHLIAIAAIYLTLIVHQPTRAIVVTHLPSESQSQPSSNPQPQPSSVSAPQPRRSSRQASNASFPAESHKKSPQDPITFLAELNISLPLIATIAQEIISLYSLWDRYTEDAIPDAPKTSRDQAASPFTGSGSGSGSGIVSPAKRSAPGSQSGSLHDTSHAGSPADAKDTNSDAGDGDGAPVTPIFLSAMLMKMREARLSDMSHPPTGRPIAINKMLERTQAVG